MNATLEDSRASAPESVTDLMEGFVSPGAVRAVQDKLNEEQLKSGCGGRTVRACCRARVPAPGRRQPNRRQEAVQAAEKATCPVYPFCS